MSAWLAPFAVVTAVLVGSGAAKVRHPQPATDMLRAVGVPVGRHAVRGAGAAEALLGMVALLSGAPALALAVAVSYAAFACLLARAVAGGVAVRSCGCLGSSDSPPGWGHVGFDVAAAAVAVAAALTGGAALPEAAAMPVPTALLALVLVAVAVRLAWLLLVDLPRLRPGVQPGLQP